MRYAALYAIFAVYFLLSPIAFAVPADANIIQRIRALKSSKQDQLSNAIDNTKQELMLSRRARVLTKSELDKLPKYDNRPGYRATDRVFQPMGNGKYRELQKNKNGQWVEKDKNSRKKDILTFNTKEQKQAKLDELQSSLKTMQSQLSRIDANDLTIIIDEFDGPFHVGTIGRIDTIPYDAGRRILRLKQEVRIIGIHDEDESIVEITYRSESVPGGPPRDYKKAFWLRGVSTVGLIDRNSITPPPLIIITGTKDYFNLGGEKMTVFVIEPLEVPLGVL